MSLTVVAIILRSHIDDYFAVAVACKSISTAPVSAVASE